jgi:hypothetical protein
MAIREVSLTPVRAEVMEMRRSGIDTERLVSAIARRELMPASIPPDEHGARVEAESQPETEERDNDRHGAFEPESRVLVVGRAMERVAGMGVDAADVLLVEAERSCELALALLADLDPAGWIAAGTLVGEHHAAHDLVGARDKKGCGLGSNCAGTFHLAAGVDED